MQLPLQEKLAGSRAQLLNNYLPSKSSICGDSMRCFEAANRGATDSGPSNGEMISNGPSNSEMISNKENLIYYNQTQGRVPNNIFFSIGFDASRPEQQPSLFRDKTNIFNNQQPPHSKQEKSSFLTVGSSIFNLKPNKLLAAQEPHSFQSLKRTEPSEGLREKDGCARASYARTKSPGRSMLFLDVKNADSQDSLSFEVPAIHEFSLPRTETTYIPSDKTRKIGTRYYRAPEIILLNKNYNSKCDVWSLGCLFAELLSLLHAQSKKGHLFPGKFCYPLSPMKVQTEEPGTHKVTSQIQMDQGDQLQLIFSTLGYENIRRDLTFIESKECREFLSVLKDNMLGEDLQRLYPGASKPAIQFLEHCLQFSPKLRYSARQLKQTEYYVGGLCEGEVAEGKLDLIKYYFTVQSLNRRSNNVKRKSILNCSQMKTEFDEDLDESSNQENKEQTSQKLTLDFDSDYYLDDYDLRFLVIREYQKYHPIPGYNEFINPYLDELLAIISKTRLETMEKKCSQQTQLLLQKQSQYLQQESRKIASITSRL